MSDTTSPPSLAARFVVALLLTLAAGAGWYAGHDNPPPAPAAQASRDVPAALWQSRLSDTASQEQPLQQWQGKPLLINFWATWCPPCREEMPTLASASQQHPHIQFIGIGIDSASNIREFSRQQPQPYPLLIGGNDALALSQQLGNHQGALPFTVLINPEGKIAQRYLGALPPETLQQWLAAYPR